MATEARANAAAVTPTKLWFGLITSAVAWVALGCIDKPITLIKGNAGLLNQQDALLWVRVRFCLLEHIGGRGQ